ncbi:MAG: hypothetical protein HYX52_09365 [Chloroflexi bacterium]|nr:hypothetical protein [Chloroflexota bacterium]
MSDDDRRDLQREEHIERLLRQRPRDVSTAPFTAVEARLRRRSSGLLVLVTTATVIAFALVIGSALAERRAASPAVSATPAGSAVTAAATSSSTPSGSPLPSPPSILSDRFGFVWVEEPTGLRIRPESGGSGSTVAALPYGFNQCGCKVSPDGTRLAYWTTRTAPDNIELRILDLAHSAGATTIYAAAPGRRIGAAAWSSDGTGIIFAIEGVNPPGSPVSNPPDTSLLAIDATGGAAQTLDANAGVYVPLGWDRAAGLAAAGISGEGGYMSGYLTVRTRGEPTPQRTAVRDAIYMLSVEVSSDQRYALGVFLEVGRSGGTVRWWRLSDFAAQTPGPQVDSPSGAKWRPGTMEFGWIEGGALQLRDVEGGTMRASGSFPASDYALAAFRQDGSAVVGTGSSGTLVLDISSGRSERIVGSGSIGGAVRLR